MVDRSAFAKACPEVVMFPFSFRMKRKMTRRGRGETPGVF
jgi:hypothetical protein